jgi:hypothetical protein
MKIPKEIDDRINYKRNKHKELNRLVGDIEPILTSCEDCQAICDRKISMTRTHYPIAHWKTKCLSCNKYKNPATGKFDDITAPQINAFLAKK